MPPKQKQGIKRRGRVYMNDISPEWKHHHVSSMSITTEKSQSMRRWRKSQWERKEKEKETPRCEQGLDLALDINFLECCTTRSLEERTGFTSQERNVVCSVFQQVLTLMIDYKLGRISIRLETEFFSNEAKLDIRLVSRNQLANSSSKYRR